jgi:hypothetical protein
MAHTACLVCFISTVNGHSKNKKNKKMSWKTGTSSGHITNLKQSILETFDIYGNVTKLMGNKLAAAFSAAQICQLFI